MTMSVGDQRLEVIGIDADIDHTVALYLNIGKRWVTLICKTLTTPIDV